MDKGIKLGRDPGDEIWVNEFTEESASEFRKAVLEESKGNSTRPIIVYIDSYGGQVDALSTMIETMDEVPNPIVTVAVGKAMSCGAVLLSHGNIRLCGKHARVMVHEVSNVAAGDVHDMYADALETKRLNRWFMGLLARNCGLKGGYGTIRKIIKKQDGRDRYMDAKAALEFGIVDAVGMPRISRMKFYQVDVTPPKRQTGIKPKNQKSESKPKHRRGSNVRREKVRRKSSTGSSK
jgi:ATP-dependent Clp protease, protease subunit